MTIIENLKDENVIIRNIYYKNGLIEEVVAVIDVDYSLIKYLGKVFVFNDIIINNSGYPIIATNNTITTLYRLILEYYSKYDNDLKQILQDKKYEINHKNKDKLDNRVQNLEIVTHKNNIRHSMGKNYAVTISTKRLLEIQNKSKESKQQKIDEEYLSRQSGLWYKSMKNNVIDKKILKCSYFSFRNVTNKIEYQYSNRCYFKQFFTVK